MASFSPEWVALRWALRHDVPVRFADLPARHTLAPPGGAGPDGGARAPRRRRRRDPARADPIGALAAAAGFDDPERWWEDAIEHRRHGLGAFALVLEAMAALRTDADGADTDGADADDDGDGALDTDGRREAAMRRALREAMRQHDRVVFVCGAWHAPVLRPEAFPPARVDDARLRGLPRTPVAATWVPWSNERLTFASGYGAGVSSPGWYEHLFTAPADVSARWLARTAALLRDERLDVSPAAVIEAVRLADTLAVLRDRPLAGLAELTDASEAALCGGSTVPLRIVARRLLVGDALGAVPPETPMVPLARDLERQLRRLRMKRTSSLDVVVLDLRNPTHRGRSQLLRRLGILGVHWGRPADAGRTGGTFKEGWRLDWQPELALALIDASGAGTTIEEAATTTVTERIAHADIGELTDLVEEVLLADLPDALEAAMAALADRSARQHDTQRLMAAVEPLARVSRYGNVRQVDTEVVLSVLHGIAVRVAVGLGMACRSLDDESADLVRSLIESVDRGLALVDDRELRDAWADALAGVAGQHGVHGTVAGRVVRMLLDAGRLSTDQAGRRLSLALSRVDGPAGAAWLDGFLAGDAALLIHDEALLRLVDEWVSAVPPDAFDDLLPLLRRTFSAFSRSERRLVQERVRRLADAAAPTAARLVDPGVDAARAARAAPVLRRILGIGS
jgi:hypothetical protein